MLRHCTGNSHHQSVATAAPGKTMASTTFSLFFPLPTKGPWPPAAADEAGAFDDDRSSITTSPSSPSSSSSAGSVDCTLSLGTPSSRRAAAEPAEQAKRAAAQPAYPSVSASASASAVSWDVAADQPYYYCCHGSKPAAAGAAKGAVARAEHDQLLVDRRCANCGTSSTPLWRNGPRGPKSLCNACGIRFKKEERRAAATAMDQGQGACGYVAQRAQYGTKQAPADAVPYYGEAAFPCGGGDVADAEAAPFLAWRLNVVAPSPAPAPAFAVWPERTSLFQYN
ncbi:hypothetical protein SEVIR_3G136200v4 [Setaria viridis]|nr:GATA transcription factor 15 [Setaria italica]XP_034584990.1 GATA transcription factor 15-like [Setaria viridis]RCV16398.1 hypothetical protein SETIT_3G134600v2 [Setaria italica]TKW25714.1 hypothetical protein SEVIR_3G136200v2 [Setaria viridis]